MQDADETGTSFVRLSAALTGFDESALLGTGMARAYFERVEAAAGRAVSRDLWAAAAKIFGERSGATKARPARRGPPAPSADRAALEVALRRNILASPKLGPVARSLMQLWYSGSWVPLPADWTAEYGSHAGDKGETVSSEAYRQGLMWVAAQSHPPGALQPGFASWSQPPTEQ